MNLTLNITGNNSSLITIQYYFINTLNFLGTFLNFICIVIFYKIIKQETTNQGHLFKYLFIKSISDFIFCLVNVPNIFYYRKDSSVDESYIMQVWFIVFYYYLSTALSQISVWFEISALIDCLCLISMKFQWHKSKLCFRIVSILVICGFFIFCLPELFKIKIKNNLNGKEGYHLIETHFNMSKYVKIYLIIHSISRELIPFCISFILNAFILCYIKKSTINRRRIVDMSVSGINSQASRLVRKAINAERNKVKMIFFTSFTHVFHLPMIFYNFNVFNIATNFLIEQLCITLFNFYFVIPIISYIGFNNTFRKKILKVIPF
jgi:hypothetical protein